jgi:hypothetical protein
MPGTAHGRLVSGKAGHRADASHPIRGDVLQAIVDDSVMRSAVQVVGIARNRDYEFARLAHMGSAARLNDFGIHRSLLYRSN